MVRCKFYCSEVAKTKWGIGSGTADAERVKFAVVYGAGNEVWAKSTPSGSFEITITNPDAMGKFEPGREYFLDVSPAAT